MYQCKVQKGEINKNATSIFNNTRKKSRPPKRCQEQGAQCKGSSPSEHERMKGCYGERTQAGKLRETAQIHFLEVGGTPSGSKQIPRFWMTELPWSWT